MEHDGHFTDFWEITEDCRESHTNLKNSTN